MATSQRIPCEVHPEIAFFAIRAEHFESDEGWRGLIDLLARHGMYNLVTVTMRLKGHAITEPETRALFGRLVAYARARGLEVALDLDPRLARGAFRRRYPNELQRVVYLQRCVLREGEAAFAIQPEQWSDHMTGLGTPYRVEAGRFVRAVAWRLDRNGAVAPASRQDVSGRVEVKTAGVEGVSGLVSGVRDAEEVAVLAEFSLFTPDVFSPHLVAYQRELLEIYADLPLRGVVKDEWGFPPTVQSMRAHRSFWYSDFYADAYQRDAGGRCLLDDLILMAVPVAGCESERLAAINRYMALNLRRQAEIEEAYYHAAKEVFGPDTLVTKHATWYPYIDEREFHKNGLSWWVARRDIAQTDEITPVSAALGMAKKFGSANWLNEGYSEFPEHYRRNIWRYAVAGGRMVFHALYPTVNGQPSDPCDPNHSEHALLLTRELLQAECRVRLLNFITTAPLDSAVAFVFGHENVMNWAGEGYLDYGEDLSLDLWRHGYAVDLYPSTELASGTFAITDDGWLRVGCQRYHMLVLYRPNMSPAETAAFLRSRPITRTALVVMGGWTHDDQARPLDGLSLLPDGFRQMALAPGTLADLMSVLQASGAPTQPPLEEPYLLFRSEQIGLPAPRGVSRLVDGTQVWISATETSDAGDAIQRILEVDDVALEVAAAGLFAARVDAAGNLAALAAGGLSRVGGGGFDLTLPEPLDLALWRNAQGTWHGVVQGLGTLQLPEPLRPLAADWRFLSVPPSFEPPCR